MTPKLRRALLVLLPLALLAGCGGEEAKPMTMDQAQGTPAAAAPATKKGENKRKGDGDFKANPAWDRIAPHFFVFVGTLDRELHTRSMEWKARDAFKNNYEIFFPPRAPQAHGRGGEQDRQAGGEEGPGDGLLRRHEEGRREAHGA